MEIVLEVIHFGLSSERSVSRMYHDLFFVVKRFQWLLALRKDSRTLQGDTRGNGRRFFLIMYLYQEDKEYMLGASPAWDQGRKAEKAVDKSAQIIIG
jgi:hypothetical protein